MSIKPEVELILPLLLWKGTFNVIYPENGEIYNVERISC